MASRVHGTPFGRGTEPLDVPPGNANVRFAAVRPLALRRQFSLLEDGRFRLLFLATFASGIGNWLAVIALQIDVYNETRSGWWIGALLIATFLPAVFLGLLAGPLVDRLSRKGLMIGSDLGRLAVFVV